MRGLTNTSYIFIPFSFYKQADFDSLIEAFDKNNAWEQLHDELTYMLDAFQSVIKAIRKNPLKNDIKAPHVTFKYRPSDVDDIISPLLTFGAVLSIFKNVSALVRYYTHSSVRQ